MKAAVVVIGTLLGCKEPERAPDRRPLGSAAVEDAAPRAVIETARRDLDFSRVELGDPPASMVRVSWGVISEPDLYIDRTEVTIAAYRDCVVAGACTEPDTCGSKKSWAPQGHDNYPVSCVSAAQALNYCSFRGKRLPTSVEWLRAAAIGDDGQLFPWGNATPSCGLAVLQDGDRTCGKAGKELVGSRPRGASQWGALDMVGNVAEIVNRDASGKPKRAKWIFLGGSYRTRFEDIRSALTDMSWEAGPFAHIGFRCARRAGENTREWVVAND